MKDGIETSVKNNMEVVSFVVGSMPKTQFIRFKEFAREWGDNYWVTIKALMDWFDKSQLLLNFADENKKADVKFIGDENE